MCSSTSWSAQLLMHGKPIIPLKSLLATAETAFICLRTYSERIVNEDTAVYNVVHIKNV